MAEQDKAKVEELQKTEDIKATTDKEKTTTKSTDEKVAVKKVKRSKSKRTVTEGKAYIQSSYNNTIVTVTDLEGNVIGWSSAGANGFKGAKKATPYAAQISAEAAINKALLYGIEKLEVFVKGVGAGREQAIRGLHASGVNIESITDQTPVPHNGCRPRKARRV